MNAVMTNETAAKPQNWCYTAKAQDTAGAVSVENGGNQALFMAPMDLNIQPYQFTSPLKAAEQSESEKQLLVTRMTAFGRSFGEQTWG